MRDNVHLSHSLNNKKKMVIAELMDANSHIFLRPINSLSWMAMADGDHFPSPKEMLQIDKAIGMIMQVFNQSKSSISEEQHLNGDEMFIHLESEPPNVDTSEGDDVAEVEVELEVEVEVNGSPWATAVAAFNHAKQNTNISENDVIEQIYQAFDRHSGQSALSQGVVEAAKQIIQLDLEFAMSDVVQA